LINSRGRFWNRSDVLSAASIAAARISARSTMPGPPPAGVSSTLRWRSVAESRISRASNAQIPNASPLPARLVPSGPGNISGYRVRTVARQGEAIGLNRASAGRNQYTAAVQVNQQATQSRLLATIFDQLDHIVDSQMFVGFGNKGSPDPVIDRGRV